jgi:hypothetical protein
MTNWNQIARGLGLEATDDELSKMLAPLPRLEEELKALTAKSLSPDSEPAVTFTAQLEGSAE